ncbi:MAG TPA: hypothetical protein VJ963_11725 [Bacteroidales bacterium]|nr:hypothetical protein [Bacteroidales bacterium]
MKRAWLFTLFFVNLNTFLHSQPGIPTIVKSYSVPSSKQAVAVDSAYFYVINNSSITKHQKRDGKLVSAWEDRDSLIHHLNSGIIIDGKLYTVNSNYPGSPMAGSVEIFDPETLHHIDSHSFGILNGSPTWLDLYEGYWYVAFAHYTGRGSEPGKDNSWTRLVKFDEKWRQLESWIFPEKLIAKFGTKSNSGGIILPEGNILCTGHDNYELYLLEFPIKGYTLMWKETFPVGSYGQGIACEQEGDSTLIWGIVKNENMVMVSRIDY